MQHDHPLTYAIGDVHGRADLLEPMLEYIERDAGHKGREPRVIFLGDIVDRGPDSRGAIELVIAALQKWPASRLLLGNHDDWYLGFLRDNDEDAAAAWMVYGGFQTLESYLRGDPMGPSISSGPTTATTSTCSPAPR